jgi:hypothetical protein
MRGVLSPMLRSRFAVGYSVQKEYEVLIILVLRRTKPCSARSSPGFAGPFPWQSRVSEESSEYFVEKCLEEQNLVRLSCTRVPTSFMGSTEYTTAAHENGEILWGLQGSTPGALRLGHPAIGFGSDSICTDPCPCLPGSGLGLTEGAMPRIAPILTSGTVKD